MDDICYICGNKKDIKSGLLLPLQTSLAFVCYKCLNRMSELQLQNKGFKTEFIPQNSFKKINRRYKNVRSRR